MTEIQTGDVRNTVEFEFGLRLPTDLRPAVSRRPQEGPSSGFMSGHLVICLIIRL